MSARSLHQTSILLTLLAVLALTAGAAISAQPVPSQAGVQATTNASDAGFRSSPVMFIENAGLRSDQARFQSLLGPNSRSDAEISPIPGEHIASRARSAAAEANYDIEYVSEVGGMGPIAAAEGKVYVGAGTSLLIFDVSNPALPVELTRIAPSNECASSSNRAVDCM